MSKRTVALDDKYTRTSGDVYMSSIQALVRLPMMQRQRDVAAGLNTAGYVTGYRGSPIGTYDFSLWSARNHLQANHIKFVPAVNEELGAAAIKGTQWLDRYPKKTYDGVFALWYGKHLGVERAAEALKIGNYDGSDRHGGVLVVGADDIGGKSSITAAESDHIFIAGMLPILAPADTQEYLDFGMHGWALSRFSGLWVGFKAVTDNIELTKTVDADINRVRITLPTDFQMPPGGLNSRGGDYYPLPMERRVVDFKLPAARAYARANGLDRVVFDSERRGLGIVSTGKAYLDTREALRELGIDDTRARSLGIRLYKVGLVWPLDTESALKFGRGHQELLCLEEKRPVIEEQLTYAFYHEPASARPVITGKHDDKGADLKPAHGELSVNMAADIIARRIEALGLADEPLKERIAAIQARKAQVLQLPASNLIRTAYFCSGCPHNTSTNTVEGSMAFTGVGCYGLVPMLMPERKTEWAAQMGAEGSLWVGLQNFVDIPHAFQNLGDGTYFHSGVLAIRQSVSAKANITYKMLYNDAVAMTGGQPIDGKLSVEDMANQIYWEGVRPIVIVTDEPDKYPSTVSWPPGTTIRHRKELELVQKELQQVKGVSCLIYDQTCAAEKRRRRKRGTFPNPPKRLFINQEVCEGCGDCNKKSNCVSVQPLDTEFGRKRKIDQSNCNKDYSCQEGFCPSFVSIHGGSIRKAEKRNDNGGVASDNFLNLPAPAIAPLGDAYNVLITGIGGTGVLTVGSILGMAAHLDDKACSVMDITGMAQKGGSVVTHLRFGASQDKLFATRLWENSANLLIGCDLVVTTSKPTLDLLRTDSAQIVVNSDLVPTAQFQQNNAIDLSQGKLINILKQAVTERRLSTFNATSGAVRLIGDSIATNVMMLGYAVQKGLMPVSLSAIESAIQLNGVAIEQNLQALNWGRLAAHDPQRFGDLVAQAAGDAVAEEPITQTLDELVARRVRHLTEYQDAAYAARYSAFIDEVRNQEQARAPGSTAVTMAVARYLSKLMSYKDEYEVARLYTNGDFLRRLRQQFDGDYTLNVHLSPPLFNPKDKATGKPRKIAFGPWMLKAFGLLAKLKGLRGGALDVFGYTAERRMERRLIEEYRSTMTNLLPVLNSGNVDLVAKIAALPEMIKGYGHIKDANVKLYEAELANLLMSFDQTKKLAA